MSLTSAEDWLEFQRVVRAAPWTDFVFKGNHIHHVAYPDREIYGCDKINAYNNLCTYISYMVLYMGTQEEMAQPC